MSTNYLGFPAPLLGPSAVRLPILFDEGDLVAIQKPIGVVVQQDPWYVKRPSLIEAIRYQAMQGKPEFERRGIGADGLWAVTDLDAECQGPVLFCRSRERAELLRNAVGSGAFEFTFIVLAKGATDAEEITCDLPLARHSRRAHMLVSHTTGKKAQTVYRRVGTLGHYTCLEARTPFARRHQVLLHALESGLPVLGDGIYAGSKEIYLSSLKKDYRPRRQDSERPLYPGPAYYLKSIKVPEVGVIEGEEPRQWVALFKQLSRHG